MIDGYIELMAEPSISLLLSRYQLANVELSVQATAEPLL